MIKNLLCGLALLSASVAAAEDYPSMVFELTDGTKVVLPSENLSMVFDASNLLAAVPGGTQEIPVDRLAKFYFSQETTGIADVVADGSGLQVFTITGIRIGSFTSPNEARAALPAGFYIVQSNSQTYKTVIK